MMEVSRFCDGDFHSQTIVDRILKIGLEPSSEIFLGFFNTSVPMK